MSWIQEAIERLDKAGQAYREAAERRKNLRKNDPTGGRRQEELELSEDFNLQADFIVEHGVGRRKVRPEPRFQTRQPDESPKLPRQRDAVIYHASDDPESQQAEPISPPLADWLGGGVTRLTKSVFKRIAPPSLTRMANDAQRRHGNPNARIK